VYSAEENIARMERQRELVSKAERRATITGRNWDEGDIRRAKKWQAPLSTTAATLGMAGLAQKVGAGGITRLGGRAMKAGKLDPAVKLKRMARSAHRGSDNLFIASGGVGGVGGLNFARIERAEANLPPKRKTKQ
jgi:hypothetical protein